MDLIELIKAGGTIGYIIMLLSVVGLGLVFENMYTVRRSALMPDEVVGEVERLFQEENYEEALNLCDSEPSLLTNMLGAGLTKLQGGYDAMTDAMGEALEEGATRIHQKINYLDLIANVAPMLGLLGTVQGMIQAFMKLAGGTPKPGELAGDISLALVTTAQGLIVAIPMLTFKMIIKNRIVRILMEVSAVSNELVERFKSK
jgi:biopolymer transport protein ExbB